MKARDKLLEGQAQCNTGSKRYNEAEAKHLVSRLTPLPANETSPVLMKLWEP